MFVVGFACVVPIQFLKFFAKPSFSELSPCACTTIIVFVLPAFFSDLISPSRSVTTISGFKPFSIIACVAPSATIFVIFLYFFKIGMEDGNDGPAPTMKTGLFSIKRLIFTRSTFFGSIESNSLHD